MHHNISMFDVHRVPPVFPAAPSANLSLDEGERSLALILFIAKVVSIAKGNGRAVPISSIDEDDSISAAEDARSPARKVGAAC